MSTVHGHSDMFAHGRNERKEFKETIVYLAAGKGDSVPLGTYEHGKPIPKFDVVYDPEIESELMGAKLDRIDSISSNRCLLTYHFHNYSSKSCYVTIRRHGNEDTKDMVL